jgi:preprotein translocase subunit YajC
LRNIFKSVIYGSGPFGILASGILASGILASGILATSESAFAQSAPAGGGPPAYMQMLPLLVGGALLIFMNFKSQAKKQKDQKAFNEKLKRGDRVITASGILGQIEGLTDTFITLEIAKDVKIKILKSQIIGLQDEVKS